MAWIENSPVGGRGGTLSVIAVLDVTVGVHPGIRQRTPSGSMVLDLDLERWGSATGGENTLWQR